jgi:predicted ester cyclase
MSSEENKVVLHRLAEEFNKRNFAAIDEVFSPNFVLHDANQPNWPRGFEGAHKMFTAMLAAAPDLQVTIEDSVAEGDKVVVRWTFRGTHTGVSATGAAPTGEPITVLAIGIYRLVAGKIEEDWGMGARCLTATPWE